MDVALVAQFWVIAVLLALTPGADWAYAVAAGLRSRTPVPSVLGMLTGYALVVTVVAVGLGAVIAQYPTALTVLTFAGAGYLLWLGISNLRGPAARIEAGGAVLQDAAARQFARGAGISALNPKGLLLLVALLPQFTSPIGWPAWNQMLLLGGLHLANCAVVYSTVALLAQRVLRSRPRAGVVVTRVAGIVMVLVGAGILLENLVHLLR